MEILMQIANYGIIAAVIGLIAFILCGIGKLFFVPRINAKYGLASLQGDEYDKAKAKATAEIRKICNAISVTAGIVLLVPFYIYIMEHGTFYQDILFWTNLFAIPNISALFYVLYQGAQTKNISVKQWLHKLVNLVIALFKYFKKLKIDKTADSSELAVEVINILAPLATEEEKEKLKKLLLKK